MRRRPDGKWRARYRDAEGRERAKHFARKVEADQWLIARQAEVQRGEHLDVHAAKQRFSDYFDEWAARQLWADGTRISYRTTMRSVTFADVPIGRVQRSHVEAWIKHLETGGIAPSTVRTRQAHVSAVLRAATRDRVIGHNPAEGVTLPRLRRREIEMVVPSQGDVGALLEAVEPRLCALVALCAFAGMRIGEACAVQLGDVDFLRRRIYLRRQALPGGAIGAPKHGGERDIAAADTLLQILARHVEVNDVGGAGWLFPGRIAGRPVTPGYVRHWWQRALGATGLRVKIHDLRHFYASGLIAAGCDPVTVQRALGHSTPSITLNQYSHLWPTAEDRTRAAADELARSACGLSADQPSGRTATAQ